MLPDTVKNVLSYFFSTQLIGGSAERNAVDETTVAVVERAKRLLVALGDQHEQLVVPQRRSFAQG